MTTLLLSHPGMLAHDAGPGHPERADRLRAIDAALDGARLGFVNREEPRPAGDDPLLAVHTPAHLAMIDAQRGRSFRLDLDTGGGPESVAAARLAAGAALDAVDAVLEERCGSAFALVRPPGHHAEPARAMGFCLLSNAAVAAARAVERGCRRVLVLDFDVHHGNGTQAATWTRDDIVLLGSHQWPHFPGTGRADERGAEAGAGWTFNLPLPAGCDDDAVVAVWARMLPAVAAAVDPDLVLVSAGYDAHADDPLGGLRMTAGGFGVLAGMIRTVAERHADGRLALVLEGGYDLPALAASALETLRALDPRRPAAWPDPEPAVPAALDAMVRAHLEQLDA